MSNEHEFTEADGAAEAALLAPWKHCTPDELAGGYELVAPPVVPIPGATVLLDDAGKRLVTRICAWDPDQTSRSGYVHTLDRGSDPRVEHYAWRELLVDAINGQSLVPQADVDPFEDVDAAEAAEEEHASRVAAEADRLLAEAPRRPVRIDLSGRLVSGTSFDVGSYRMARLETDRHVVLVSVHGVDLEKATLRPGRPAGT